MNFVRSVIERDGKVVRVVKEEQLVADKYAALVPEGTSASQPRAEVAMDLGTWGGANFTAKVSVRLTCVQTKAMMDEAALLAFNASMEYLQDAWQVLNGQFGEEEKK